MATSSLRIHALDRSHRNPEVFGDLRARNWTSLGTLRGLATPYRLIEEEWREHP